MLNIWVVDNLLPDHVGLPHVLVLTVHLVGILTILTGILNGECLDQCDMFRSNLELLDL